MRALEDVGGLLQVSRRPIHLFQAACALSLTSTTAAADTAKAIKHLSSAVAQDPRLVKRAKEDKDLARLREAPEYLRLLEVLATPP